MYQRLVELCGFWFTMKFVGPEEILDGCGEDHYGCCDHPGAENPSILIDNTLDGQKRMEIIIHEMLHGLFPQASESVVKKAADQMARTLTEEGYQRTKT